MSRKLVRISEEDIKRQKRKDTIREILKKLRTMPYILILFIVPIVSYFLMEFMIRNPFEKMKWNIQVLNMWFFELLMLILFFAFGSIRAAVRTEVIFAYLVGLVDYYIISFRGTPVQPWDINSIRVAASVADNYSYKIGSKIVITLLIVLAICVVFHWINYKIDRKDKKKLLVNLCCLLVAFVSMYGYIRYVQADSTVKKYGIYDKLFTPTTMTYKDGTVVAFLMECKYLNIDKPSGYSDKKAEGILAQYGNDAEFGSDRVVINSGDSESDNAGTTVSETSPNIIIIMDEAFSDLSVLGDYSTNVGDEIPFVRSMLAGADNTVSGYLDVSVVGGNTANTEFEFLTGNSMAWLPQGSVPYQQYVKKNKESMASILKNQGYSTVAIHPYKAAGWDRDKTYKYFGFDSFLAIDDFYGPEILRKYVSDDSDFNKVIDIYNSKEAGQPIFIFNVTMQNHSSYTEEYDNFPINVEVDGVDKLATNQYLSLLNRTDESLEWFISYMSASDEPTIVVFFGDHQPTDSVVNPICKLNGKSTSDMNEEELRDRYKVPFFIWANYDIEEQTGVSISPNLLGVRTMDIAGVKMSAYERYLLDMSKSYVSISTMGITDASGNTTSVKESSSKLTDYQMLQYYMLFR